MGFFFIPVGIRSAVSRGLLQAKPWSAEAGCKPPSRVSPGPGFLVKKSSTPKLGFPFSLRSETPQIAVARDKVLIRKPKIDRAENSHPFKPVRILVKSLTLWSNALCINAAWE